MDRAVASAAPHLRNAAGAEVITGADRMDEELRRRNLRTALWLAATAVAVFVAFVVRYGMSGQ